MRVLVIGYVWPEPKSSAAGTHMLSLLKLFKQQNWQVEFATPAQPTDHMVKLEEFGVSSKKITLNCESFDDYIMRLNPDIVMFDRFMMEEQFGWRVDKYAPNAVKILDTEDLQCLRHARHSAHKSNREFDLSDLQTDIAKREIAAILRCDLSLIISSFEMSLLKSFFNVPSALCHHLPFMVHASALIETLPNFETRSHFMTIGNFRHAPNWDAVLYLQEIWPLIRKQLPNAELHIYGSYPPPKATALHNTKTGFLIKGWAADANKVMQNARVCLAPIRFGAGIKGKLLEAMINQTPSVTTDIGAEGMTMNHNWPGKIANNPEEFAQAAVELYNNKITFEESQKNAMTLLNTFYDQEHLGSALIYKITQVNSNLAKHRMDNFTGQMLKHHTMRSTQYMAQWIEEKNKNISE